MAIGGAGIRGPKRIVMMTQLFFSVLFCYGFMLADGQKCSVPNTVTLGDVNSNEFTGQVKYCLYDYWGAVCAFDTSSISKTLAAEVVCYELGYLGEGARLTTGGPNTVVDSFVWLGKVKCQGYEEKLNSCGKDIFDIDYTKNIPQECQNPQPTEIAYVTCPKESQVRLHNHEEGKIQDYRGVVEHWYNGSWHVLCDTGNWTLNDSQVVCQQLGLGNAVEPVCTYEGSMGSLDYFQNKIHCRSNEKMIKNCRIEEHWNTSSTCNGTVVNVMCEGPVVQSINIISRTQESVTFSWKLPSNFYNYNTVVVTEFRVEYWPKDDPSKKRCFNRPAVFDNATMDLLDPDTTYEMMIVPMMGEHHGPNGSVWSVKTNETTITPEPVDGAIVGLSCALALSCMVIAILFGVIIRHFIRRRRHGYHGIPHPNGGFDYNIMLCI